MHGAIPDVHGTQYSGQCADTFLALREAAEPDPFVGRSDEEIPLLNCPMYGPILNGKQGTHR